jgi:hypothetical protein
MKLLFFISAGLRVDAYCEDGHYPSPGTNCQAFYQCAHGEKLRDIYCPAGTLFNSDINVCDWSYNVDCEKSTSTTTKKFTTTKRTTTKRTTTKRTTTTVVTTTENLTLPADFCPVGHYPAPGTDCKGFYQCDHGVQLPTIMCPEGTLYNPEIMVCDWPYNVACDDESEVGEKVECYKRCVASGKNQLICGKKCYGNSSTTPPATTTVKTTTQADKNCYNTCVANGGWRLICLKEGYIGCCFFI